MELTEKTERYFDYSIILILHSLNHILMFSLPVLILYFRDDYNLNYTQSGILWTILVITMTVASIGVGLVSDDRRYIRYPLIYFGLALMIVGWFIVKFASGFGMLIPIFALIGLGGSAFHPPAMAIITEIFEENKGRALSIFMVTGMGFTALSPIIFAGIEYIVGSWEQVTTIIAFGVMIVGIILLFLTSITGMFNRTEWTASEPEKYAVQKFSEGETANLTGYDLTFLLSALILVPLLFISLRSSFSRTSTLFTSLLFEDYLSLSKSGASIATAAVLGFSSLFTIVGGTISDKTKPIIAILISSIGTFIAASALVFLTDYSSIPSFMIFYFLMLSFYYIGSPATSALIADRVDPKQRGKLFGALFSLGQILGLGTPIIFGWIKDTRGLAMAFGFILALATIAMLIGIYIFQEENERSSSQTIPTDPTISD